MATATLAASLRSLGRAGMFSLSVLRASLPTRDFFAERAGAWLTDYSVDLKMAYNHYFSGTKNKA